MPWGLGVSARSLGVLSVRDSVVEIPRDDAAIRARAWKTEPERVVGCVCYVCIYSSKFESLLMYLLHLNLGR